MTPQEAIRLLIMEQEKPRNCGCEMYVALDMAVNALVKQIPKKPKRKPCMILCPNCESTSITLINHAPTEESYIKLAHCIECGQAIDWEGCTRE